MDKVLNPQLRVLVHWKAAHRDRVDTKSFKITNITAICDNRQTVVVDSPHTAVRIPKLFVCCSCLSACRSWNFHHSQMRAL
jgi:hypothetical protein